MDPIAIIKDDHRRIEEMFEEYEALGDTAYKTKRTLVDAIIRELELHAEMEETLVYPLLKDKFNREEDAMVEEAYAEHEVAKHLMAELKGLEPEDPQFDAKVTVLQESIAHHVEEEETDLLPQAEEEFSEEELAAIGVSLEEFKADHIDAEVEA
jgi:hemerythrin-like domain-containing protein